MDPTDTNATTATNATADAPAEKSKLVKRWPWVLVPAALALVLGAWAPFAQSKAPGAAAAVGKAPPPTSPPAATCTGTLPDSGTLRNALVDIVKQGKQANTGMGNHQWAVIVNRDGIVCAVVFSGPDRGAQWPASRVIAAEKASTANALSTPDFALSTANLYFPSQPGQSLYGLVTSAPPNPQAAYVGDPVAYGEPNDPMVGKPIGGAIAFGGGLPLYDRNGKLLGGLGVSGDTACADHVVAWKVRHSLALDAVPAGIGKNSTDNMILDMQGGNSASGFGHPSCKGGKPSDDVINNLTAQFPTGKKR